MPRLFVRRLDVQAASWGVEVAPGSNRKFGKSMRVSHGVGRRIRRRPLYKTIRIDLSNRKSQSTSPTSNEDANVVSRDCNAFISRSTPKNSERVVAELDRLMEGAKPQKRPFAVKDNIATEDCTTTCGSGILQNYQSPFEATIVNQLRHPAKKTPRQGKALVGKTNLDEFGMGSHSINSFFGPVRGMSPLRRHSVGGSSGGSAMAVVTEDCDYALGTDTGGSVRLPAAYTGIVGFKPSYGRISRWGVIPYANSLDTVGVMGKSTRKVMDALPREVMHSGSRDPTSLGVNVLDRMQSGRRMLAIRSHRNQPRPMKRRPEYEVEQYLQQGFNRLRIGIPMEYNIAELDHAVKEEWQHALELFQEKGCDLVPISLPNTKHALSAYYVIAAAEAASNLAKYDGVRYGTRANSVDGAGGILYSKTRGEGFGDEVKRRILLGAYSLSSKAIDNYFIKAQKLRRLIQRDFDRVFSLPNLLRSQEQFDLSDIDETVLMESKKGPPQVDFIVCPTAPTLPPTRHAAQKQSSVETYMNDVFTVPSSLAGLPAISLPFKLPGEQPGFAGIQIIGQFSDDFRLLLTASALETLQRRKATIISKHLAPITIGKHYSSRTTKITKTLAKDWSFRLPTKKHPSPKGDRREPRTPKEIDRFVEDAFEDWDMLTSSNYPR